jgi:hypothetical protein
MFLLPDRVGLTVTDIFFSFSLANGTGAYLSALVIAGIDRVRTYGSEALRSWLMWALS